jgi:hypothetical protein
MTTATRTMTPTTIASRHSPLSAETTAANSSISSSGLSIWAVKMRSAERDCWALSSLGPCRRRRRRASASESPSGADVSLRQTSVGSIAQ